MIKRIAAVFRISFILLLLMTGICGLIYPLMVTAIAQIAFPGRSHGSIIQQDGVVIGSVLLGQEFTRPEYFWGRPSATTPPYNAAASGGSNFSPSNPKLLDVANARIEALQKADPKNKNRIPIDLITASGSGLDPDISLGSAEYQIARVAKARHMTEEEVRNILGAYVRKPLFGVWGEAKVNVLTLNLGLDQQSKAASKEKR